MARYGSDQDEATQPSAPPARFGSPDDTPVQTQPDQDWDVRHPNLAAFRNMGEGAWEGIKNIPQSLGAIQLGHPVSSGIKLATGGAQMLDTLRHGSRADVDRLIGNLAGPAVLAKTLEAAGGSPTITAGIPGALRGASKAATGTTDFNKFGVKVPIPNVLATGAAGAAGAKMVGLPGWMGGVPAALYPIVRGGIEGAGEAISKAKQAATPSTPHTPIWANLPSPTAEQPSAPPALPRVQLPSGRTVGGPAIDVRTGQTLTPVGSGEFSNVSPVNTRAIPTKVTVIPRAVEPEPGPYPEGVGIHGGVENTPIPTEGQPPPAPVTVPAKHLGEVPGGSYPERYDEGSAAPKIAGSEAKSTIVARQLLDHLQEKGFTWDDVQALNPEEWRDVGNQAGVGKPNKLVIQKVMNRMQPAPESGITLSPELQQRLQSTGSYQTAQELKRALGQ